MVTLTINARHRKHYKAGNHTPETANEFGSVSMWRRTRSRRDWLDRLERDIDTDREAAERKQEEKRRRNRIALLQQKQESEATKTKGGMFRRAVAWLRRLAKVA